MDTVFNLLDELEDLLESCKTVAFSGNKVAVSKDEVFEIISEIRLNLPGEIKQAQRLADNCEKIINDAQNKASAIIKEAEDKAERMTTDHEITKLANEQASVILDEAKDTARALRIGAVEYADELLANSENAIKECLESFSRQARQVEDFLAKEGDILYENRQELRETE